MFERLSHTLSQTFFTRHADSHDDYLASAGDHAQLERRMRQIEEEDHSYSLSFCGSMPHHDRSFD